MAPGVAGEDEQPVKAKGLGRMDALSPEASAPARCPAPSHGAGASGDGGVSASSGNPNASPDDGDDHAPDSSLLVQHRPSTGRASSPAFPDDGTYPATIIVRPPVPNPDLDPHLVSWPELCHMYPYAAEGRAILLHLIDEPRPFLRWTVSGQDTYGNIATVAFYVRPERLDRPPLHGLRRGAWLYWENPRGHWFLDGQFGARIENEDLRDMRLARRARDARAIACAAGGGGRGGGERGPPRGAGRRRTGAAAAPATGVVEDADGAADTAPRSRQRAAARGAERPPPERRVAAPQQEWSAEQVVPLLLLALGFVTLCWLFSA